MEVKFKAEKKDGKIREWVEVANNKSELDKKIATSKLVKSLFKSVEVYADNKLVYSSK